MQSFAWFVSQVKELSHHFVLWTWPYNALSCHEWVQLRNKISAYSINLYYKTQMSSILILIILFSIVQIRHFQHFRAFWRFWAASERKDALTTAYPTPCIAYGSLSHNLTLLCTIYCFVIWKSQETRSLRFPYFISSTAFLSPYTPQTKHSVYFILFKTTQSSFFFCYGSRIGVRDDHIEQVLILLASWWALTMLLLLLVSLVDIKICRHCLCFPHLRT